MQKQSLHIVPTIEAALTGRQYDVLGNEYGHVNWATPESCIGMPSDNLYADNFKQSNAPNRMM